MPKWNITVVRYDGGEDTEEDISALQEREILEIAESMDDGVSNALMVIEKTEDSALYVNVTQGRYAITARIGYDTFYEFIGSDPRVELVPYVTGGQSMKIPARQLTSADLAIAVVRHYLQTGEIDREEQNWEVQ